MMYRTLRDPTTDEMAAMLDLLAGGFGVPFIVEVDGPVYRIDEDRLYELEQYYRTGIQASLRTLRGEKVLVEVGEGQTPSTKLKIHTECEHQPSVKVGMHQRVADALAMEFNDEDARWATDSVIEAVFGRDDWSER